VPSAVTGFPRAFALACLSPYAAPKPVAMPSPFNRVGRCSPPALASQW
jgi:hypothetical protein